jgi:hypothetical protein
MVDCPDIDCRDKIFKAIHEAKTETEKKITACKNEQVESRRSNIVNWLTAAGLILFVLGGFFGLWNLSISDAQDKTEQQVETLKSKSTKVSEKQVAVSTRLGAVEKELSTVKDKVDDNHDLLIKIGTKLGIDEIDDIDE